MPDPLPFVVIANAKVWHAGAFSDLEVRLERRAGKIVEIAPRCERKAADLFDAHGHHVIPGVIDAQVHFRDPGFPEKEDLASGSAACAKGGVTTYLDMPNTRPPTISRLALQAKRERAREVSVVNGAFFPGATADNLDALNELDNIPGVKMFMGSSTGDLLVADPEVQERWFRECRHRLVVHAEDEALLVERAQSYSAADHALFHPKIRDAEVERRAVARAIDLAVKHGTRLHVLHVSSAAACRELAQAPRARITAEVTPMHLTLDDSWYESLGNHMKCNPAVKSAEDREALWQALHDGVIDFIATDHAPHTLAEKAKSYTKAPAGMPCVENSLALMLMHAAAQRCTVPEVLRWLCERPAEVYGMRAKGRLEVGADADVVCVALDERFTVKNAEQFTRCGWSPFEGWELSGRVLATCCSGILVYTDGALTGVRGHREPVFVDPGDVKSRSRR